MEKAELRKKLVNSLTSPSYGSTAEEILCTCKLVAEAEEIFNEKEISIMREELKISSQTWKRLYSVSKNETLWQYKKNLPSSFSSLYRLNLLEQGKCIFGIQNGIITPDITTREIERMLSRERIESQYKLSKRQIYLFNEDEISDEDFKILLEEVNSIAKEYKACFDTEDLEQIRSSEAKEQYNIRLNEIRDKLRRNISHFGKVKSFKELIEDKGTADEVIEMIIHQSLSEFTKMLSLMSYSRENMMYEYGDIYILKIAHEYLTTDSRAQRYNYKRRLNEVKEKYPKLKYDIDGLFARYMDL